MGFCDDSGLGIGGVWLKPHRLGKDLVWRHPWLEDIIANLVSSTNTEGRITNSNLELAALILHEATLIAEVQEAHMAAPCYGSDNAPTISWSLREA